MERRQRRIFPEAFKREAVDRCCQTKLTLTLFELHLAYDEPARRALSPVFPRLLQLDCPKTGCKGGEPHLRSCPSPWCNCVGMITALCGSAGLVRRPQRAG